MTVSDAQSRTRFIVGALLTWIPIALCFGPAFVAVLRVISFQKATGLGAVAGGISEGLMTYAIVTVFAFEVAAIVLLARTLTPRHPLRSLVAGFSILCAGLASGIVAALVWMMFRARV